MEIIRVCWDPQLSMMFIRLPDISLNIYFKGPSFGNNKWLGWEEVDGVFENKNPDRMLGNKKLPPVRDIQRLMKNLIEKVTLFNSNSNPEARNWIWRKRSEINKKKTTKV